MSAQTSDAVFEVVCAWPLSGQYGVGSRLLYYALVFMCIVGVRKAWMRNVSMAAALILPAVAAVHAIVITAYSTHAHGAIDLDLFGAFQFVSIAVLTAPVTLRYSRTYWLTPGRNLVFLWTILQLAGLLSLAVGFDRANPVPCLDQYGNNSPFNDTISDNQDSDTCNQGCFGLKTGIRQDPQNPSQYVLNMHRGITINTGLGLSVGCCVPAVLSMASIWLKLVREKLAGLSTYLPNWNSDNFESQSNMAAASTDEIRRNERISPEEKRRHDEKKMDDVIHIGLGLVERVVFSAVIVAIVILGERNFWSVEMRAGVEPMSSVGQWAPILGAVIGALGSWYTSSSDSSTATLLPVHRPHDFNGEATFEHIEQYAGELPALNFAELSRPEPALRLDRHSSSSTHPSTSEVPKVLSHRTRVNMAVHRLGVWLTPAPDRFVDDIRLTTGHDLYRAYPHTPGEELRNPHLQEHDRLHRLSVLSFYARSSPPRSPTVGIGEPGPSRHRAIPSTLTGDYLTVPLQH